MKHVVTANGKSWLEDAPDPTPEGEWVVVKVTATPICGSTKPVLRISPTGSLAACHNLDAVEAAGRGEEKGF